MKSNSEKTGIKQEECKVLTEAPKPIVKDSGFGYFYPNAVSVRTGNLRLIARETGYTGHGKTMKIVKETEEEGVLYRIYNKKRFYKLPQKVEQ